MADPKASGKPHLSMGDNFLTAAYTESLLISTLFGLYAQAHLNTVKPQIFGAESHITGCEVKDGISGKGPVTPFPPHSPDGMSVVNKPHISGGKSPLIKPHNLLIMLAVLGGRCFTTNTDRKNVRQIANVHVGWSTH